MGSDLEDGPNNHGFDYSYGSLAGAVGMYDHRYRENSPYCETWHRNQELIPGFENGMHATDLVAEDAVRVIKQDRYQPFFLMLTLHAPHTPLDERGRFVDTPTQLDPDQPNRWLNEQDIPWFHDPLGIIQQETDPEKRLFLAVVHHVDHAIGQVYQAVVEQGLANNTLILFSSDNGPQVSWGGNAYPHDLRLTDFNQAITMRGLQDRRLGRGYSRAWFCPLAGQDQARTCHRPGAHHRLVSHPGGDPRTRRPADDSA